MSLSNAGENALALLMFNNTNAANVGDATGLRGSSTAGSWYLSLHTADPGEAGSQTTSEISYTGYARKAIARSSGGFTVTNNVVTLVADQSFGKMTAGAGGTVTYIGIGTDSTGAGTLYLSGAVTPSIAVANGVIPIVELATSITFD